MEQCRNARGVLVVLHQVGQAAAVGPQVLLPLVRLGHGEVDDVVGVGGQAGHVAGQRGRSGTQRTPAASRRCRAAASRNRAPATTSLSAARATATGSATWPVAPVMTMVRAVEFDWGHGCAPRGRGRSRCGPVGGGGPPILRREVTGVGSEHAGAPSSGRRGDDAGRPGGHQLVARMPKPQVTPMKPVARVRAPMASCRRSPTMTTRRGVVDAEIGHGGGHDLRLVGREPSGSAPVDGAEVTGQAGVLEDAPGRCGPLGRGDSEAGARPHEPLEKLGHARVDRGSRGCRRRGSGVGRRRRCRRAGRRGVPRPTKESDQGRSDERSAAASA